MKQRVYRIEGTDGSVRWSLRKPASVQDHISFSCDIDKFMELDGEISKGELKGLVVDALQMAEHAWVPVAMPKDEPDRISHKNALRIIQNYEDAMFSAENQGITSAEADNVFQRLIAEMFYLHVNGTKIGSLLNDAREEIKIASFPTEPDHEE